MRQPPMPVLRKSSGAFDLPSIITGVVVVGILAAGVLAAIFGVIPFAQDRGAKQDLSSIRTAEGVAKAKDNRFMDHAGLLDVGYLQLSSTEKTKVKADAKGTCYVGIAKSGTGTLFYSTDANTDPAILEADTDTGCLTEEELAELIEDVGGIEEDTPEGAVKNLKLTAVSPLQAKATWDSAKGATGYKVEYQVEGGDWVIKDVKATSTTTHVSAQPEESVTIRVYALRGDSASPPISASVRLPDSTLKNPSFEQGGEGWSLYFATATTAAAHSGTQSMLTTQSGVGPSQIVTIPAATPVLTYWTNAAIEAWVGNVKRAPVKHATEGIWTQYKVDLSDSAGKAVSIYLKSEFAHGTVRSYIDDVALESAMVPDQATAVAASSRNGAASVTWANPVFPGGTPITSYTVSAWSDGKRQSTVEVAADQRSAVLTEVKTGSKYTYTVTANNAVGASALSLEFGPVEVLDTPIANPGFEQGGEGWSLYYATATTAAAHSGTQSMLTTQSGVGPSQIVTIPTDSPVLTYWTNAAIEAWVAGVERTSVKHATEGIWTQYKVDLSGSAGKAVSIYLKSAFAHGTVRSYIDDVALESAMVPDQATAVAASSRNGAASVTWANPVFSGGTPITSYTVSAWSDGKRQSTVEVAADQRSAVLTEVKTGSKYTYTVTANNAVGASALSLEFGPVEILDTPIANPGFEQGGAGWSLYYATATTAAAHSGTQSMVSTQSGVGPSQIVTIPEGTPVLTYWATAPRKVIAGSERVSVKHETEGIWTQYKVDLSDSAGKAVNIYLQSTVRLSYVDDVMLEPKM